MTTVGKNIIQLLEKQQYKQVDLARFLDVDVRVVNRWVKQDVQPSSKYLLEIAKFFNVSVDVLTNEKMDFSQKYAEVGAFEKYLQSLGIHLEWLDAFDEESCKILPPKEVLLTWTNRGYHEERKIDAIEFDRLIRKIGNHIKIEIENLY